MFSRHSRSRYLDDVRCRPLPFLSRHPLTHAHRTEQFIIIIAACIPPMRQLFVSFFDRARHDSDPSRYRDRKSYKITGSSRSNPYKSFDPSDDLQALQPISRRSELGEGKGAHTVTMAYPGRVDPNLGLSRTGVADGTGSDESVLQLGNLNDITKTTEVNVQYQDRGQHAGVSRIV